MCWSTFCTLCQQVIRWFLENCLRTPWPRWKLSFSALLWSGTTSTPTTTTPDVSSWGRSKTGSRGFGAAWGDCCWTLTASLKPTTSLFTPWGAGTEQGRRRAKVRSSRWRNAAALVRQAATLPHHKHRKSAKCFCSESFNWQPPSEAPHTSCGDSTLRFHTAVCQGKTKLTIVQ